MNDVPFTTLPDIPAEAPAEKKAVAFEIKLKDGTTTLMYQLPEEGKPTKMLRVSDVEDVLKEAMALFEAAMLGALKKVRRPGFLLRRKNPALYAATGSTSLRVIIKQELDDFLGSSKETSFGIHFEVVSHALRLQNPSFFGGKGGTKGSDSVTTKVLINGRTVSITLEIKSGVNWGNEASHKGQAMAFKAVAKRLSQGKPAKKDKPVPKQVKKAGKYRRPETPEELAEEKKRVEAAKNSEKFSVIGANYGNTGYTSTLNHTNLQVCGEMYWFLVSRNPFFFREVVQKISALSMESRFEERYKEAYDATVEALVQDAKQICGRGEDKKYISWDKLVNKNSDNLGVAHNGYDSVALALLRVALMTDCAQDVWIWDRKIKKWARVRLVGYDSDNRCVIQHNGYIALDSWRMAWLDPKFKDEETIPILERDFQYLKEDSGDEAL